MNPLLAQLSANVSSVANTAANGAQQASESEFVQTVLSSIDIFKNVLISVLIVIGFYVIGKLLSRRIIRALREAKGESLYPDMVALINRITMFGSLFVGFAVVIQFVFDLDFVQVVGFFGLGISFAFKDLLSNLIGGAVIIIQNRFRVGDFIQIGQNGIKGKIMEIQTRCTILKAIDGTEIIIPNAELLVKPVITFTAHHRRRIDFIIGISFTADLNKAIEVAEEVMKSDEYVLKSPAPHAIVSKVGESSVDLSMRFWIDPQNKEKSWILTKSELTAKVKQAFDANGIEIPFPIRTLQGGVHINQNAAPEVIESVQHQQNTPPIDTSIDTNEGPSLDAAPSQA